MFLDDRLQARLYGYQVRDGFLEERACRGCGRGPAGFAGRGVLWFGGVGDEGGAVGGEESCICPVWFDGAVEGGRGGLGSVSAGIISR